MIIRRALWGLLGCAATAATAAQAAPGVALDSAVFVERVQPGNVRSLEPAARVAPGDRIVTVVSWHRQSTGGGFTLTNPVPRAIVYQASAREDEEVSVDGGRTWGRLGTLRIAGRTATPEDVTHLRWRISAPAPRGQIAYAGIVR